jgi:hypothetical protein
VTIVRDPGQLGDDPHRPANRAGGQVIDGQMGADPFLMFLKKTDQNFSSRDLEMVSDRPRRVYAVHNHPIERGTHVLGDEDG